ncbi:tRNA-guanine(15) transglycosylase-like protein [Dipodascopsis tothii]|uniref:tRNA-guanine(15) transglycosylase-like protein n=1 Tax=Dipodascopsis tothii TaxID=44089 RepID=UPI0034CD95CA
MTVEAQTEAMTVSPFRILSRAHGVRAGVFRPPAACPIRPIHTPEMIVPTSRGTIPHLTPDNVSRNVPSIAGLHVGIEDYMDKTAMAAPLAIEAGRPGGHSLREYISVLPPQAAPGEQLPIFVSPRRANPIPSPQPNGDKAVSIQTSAGFRPVDVDDYLAFVERTTRDDGVVMLSPVDMPMVPGRKPRIGGNRIKKMLLRNSRWSAASTDRSALASVFAPIIPGLAWAMQKTYVDELVAYAAAGRLAGLTLWDLESRHIPESPIKLSAEEEESTASGVHWDHLPEALADVLRFSMSDLEGPHQALNTIAAGFDLIGGDFVLKTTDRGLAFTFTLPTTETAVPAEPAPLAINLWDRELFQYDTKPLVEGCQCFACKNHHRAYITHLLAVKEMVAWTLLQIHNLHVAGQLLADVREAIAAGDFAARLALFEVSYATDASLNVESPGPRVRGYQVRLGRATERLNPSPFHSL